MTVRIIPLPSGRTLGAGLDLPGAALAALADAGHELVTGDVLVVASKLVALAERELVTLAPDDDLHTARRDLARQQADRVVADHPRVLVVQTHHGLVSANAGIDTSNVPPGFALLLPRDPDDSARRLRDALAATTGVTVGVVVTDTFGRPWRQGQVDVAIGAAGVRVVRDERAGHDLWGRPLEVTVAATADEIAAAADLVRGKDTGVGFVLLRGLEVAGSGRAADLVRAPEEDLFRVGGPSMADHVVARGGPVAAPVGDEPHAHLSAMLELAGTDTITTIVGDDTGPALRVDLVITQGGGDDGSPDGGDDGSPSPREDRDGQHLVALGGVLARLEILALARGWSLDVDPFDGRRIRVRLDPAGGAQSSTTKSR